MGPSGSDSVADAGCTAVNACHVQSHPGSETLCLGACGSAVTHIQYMQLSYCMLQVRLVQYLQQPFHASTATVADQVPGIVTRMLLGCNLFTNRSKPK